MRGSNPGSNRAVLLAALLGLAAAWNAGNIGPIVTSIRDDLGISLAAIGLLSGTVFFAAVVVGTLGAQPFAERIGVARALRIACVLLVTGNIVLALSPVFGGLAAGRVIAGLGFALLGVLGPVYARSAGGVRAVAAFGSSFQLGIAVALGLGSLLEHLDVEWRVDFAVSAVIGGLALPFIPRRAQVDPPGAARGGFLRAAVRSFELARLTALFIATLGIPLIVSAWLIHYLTDEGGIEIGVAGALAFVLFGVSGVMRIAGARLLARGVSPVILGGLSPLIAAAGLLAVALSASVPVVVAAVVAMGIGFAIPYAVIIVEATRIFPAEPLAPLAFVMVWVSVAPIAVIPLIGSALAGGEGPLAFALLAGFVVAAALINLRPADRPIGSEVEGPA